MTHIIQPAVDSALIVLGCVITVLVCLEDAPRTPRVTKLLTLLAVGFALLLPVAVICWGLGL